MENEIEKKVLERKRDILIEELSRMKRHQRIRDLFLTGLFSFMIGMYIGVII